MPTITQRKAYDGADERIKRLAGLRLRRLDHQRLVDEQREVDGRRVHPEVEQALGDVGRLDPELFAFFSDQAHSRRTDRLVNAGLRDGTDRFDEPSRPQRAVTKLLLPPSETTRPVRTASGP